MIDDAACPTSLSPASSAIERQGISYTAARWTPDGLAALAATLDDAGSSALGELSDDRLLAAWCQAIGKLRDPQSDQRQALATALARFCRLSPTGLEAALEAVLGGVDRRAAERLFAAPRPAQGSGLIAVVLASNLPALAVQSLLPALVLRRPTLLKSPSVEPLFAPALVRALVAAEPALETALAAVSWQGGDEALEHPIFERAETVVAYGDQTSIDSIARRASGQCVLYGPKISLAVVSRDVDFTTVADGLARDVALFDQRGCLSIHAVYTDGNPARLATLLTAALARRAVAWPPAAIDPIVAAAVQQLRLEARLRGLDRPPIELAAGTVIVEPRTDFRPSPGLRTVRVHPLQDLAKLPALLAPWHGRLQGAALAGAPAWALESSLAALGVSRCAAPGQLQAADALWHNGGLHPFAALAGKVDTA